MRQDGYVKIWRKSRENPLWSAGIFDSWHAWEDLLLRASWKASAIPFHGMTFYVRRGQLVTTERQLSRDWRWSRNKVRHFMEMLQDCFQISFERSMGKIDSSETFQKTLEKRTGKGPQKDHGCLVVTILQYANYQDRDSMKGPRKSRKRATKEPVRSQRRATIEEDKKIEDRNTPLPPTGGGVSLLLARQYVAAKKGPTKLMDAERWFRSAIEKGVDPRAIEDVIHNPASMPGAQAWEIAKAVATESGSSVIDIREIERIFSEGKK